MNIDWVVVMCTVAVVAMGALAFYFEYGFGVEKEDKGETQERQEDISGGLK